MRAPGPAGASSWARRLSQLLRPPTLADPPAGRRCRRRASGTGQLIGLLRNWPLSAHVGDREQPAGGLTSIRALVCARPTTLRPIKATQAARSRQASANRGAAEPAGPPSPRTDGGFRRRAGARDHQLTRAICLRGSPFGSVGRACVALASAGPRAPPPQRLASGRCARWVGRARN